MTCEPSYLVVLAIGLSIVWGLVTVSNVIAITTSREAKNEKKEEQE